MRKGLHIVTVAALLTLGSAAFAQSRFVINTTVAPVGTAAEVTIEFACSVEYLGHSPLERGDRLRIRLEASSLCRGVAPSAAGGRELFRPVNADAARLLEVDYDGSLGAARVLTLSFSETVDFDVLHGGTSDTLAIRVFPTGQPAPAPRPTAADRASQRVPHAPPPRPVYAINLSSSQRPHAGSEMPAPGEFPGRTVFESAVQLASGTWYRLRLGYFASLDEAEAVLPGVRARYPTAWIGVVDRRDGPAPEPAPLQADSAETALPPATPTTLASLGLDRIDELMAEARRAMAAGELPAAVQIYTKVLRVPGHDRRAEAQEYLALARERNGQVAHARAEYGSYLEQYPDGEGAERVRQRLAALLARERQRTLEARPDGASVAATRPRRSPRDWRVQTFMSQYYRRDVNQLNDEAELVSQSALYSDLNLDVRRRGERFDFSSRVSAGYRHDFLGEEQGAGNRTRVSYAYLDLGDLQTGLRGRLGRQTRHSGGVLGRFDGFNLTWDARDRLALATVAGIPVNSASEGSDDERRFYGVSAHYGPVFDGLELGTFYIRQDVDGLRDREAVGGEFRLLGERVSAWGLVDFDTSFSELSSAYLQGSWRFATRSSLHASVDRRHSPFLSLSSAMIGQPVTSFAELRVLLTEEEIRQLSLDRSSLSTSYSVGLSQALGPRLQLNLDFNQTLLDGTPASGGVAATDESTYRYASANLTASSLFTEGDVALLGLRLSESNTTTVYSVLLDTRFPLGRSWRLNPRLRVDRREFAADGGNEWLYTPGIRIQFRRSQRLRVELEAGRQLAERDSPVVDVDRDSYFINIGYQVYF